MSMIPPKGIHRMSDAQYFSIDIPSSSGTKTLLTGTNAHLAHERANPREESDAFAIGAWTHARVLSPAILETDFIVVGKIDRRTKEGKAEWESIQRRAELNSARIITDEQRALGDAMADAVMAHPSASALLAQAQPAMREVVCIGEIAGAPAKCKVDAMAELKVDGVTTTIIIDLKTAASASASEFSRSAATFGYFHQAAWYSRIVSQVMGYPCLDFVFLAVEKDPPHLVAVYRVPEVAILSADQHLDRLASRWWAVANGDRTGYPNDIVTLEPPSWWLSK